MNNRPRYFMGRARRSGKQASGASASRWRDPLSRPADLERFQAVKMVGVPVFGAPSQEDSGQPLEEDGQGDLELEPGERGPQAEMDAPAEGGVGRRRALDGPC